MINTKNVNVYPTRPITNVNPPIRTTVKAVSMTLEQIRACLFSSANVQEILDNGDVIDLTLSNYDTDNNPKSDVAPAVNPLDNVPADIDPDTVKVAPKVEEKPAEEINVQEKIDEKSVEEAKKEVKPVADEVKAEESASVVEEEKDEKVEEVKEESVVEESKPEETVEEKPADEVKAEESAPVVEEEKEEKAEEVKEEVKAENKPNNRPKNKNNQHKKNNNKNK